MKNMWIIWLAVIASMGLVVAACGGESADDTSTPGVEAIESEDENGEAIEAEADIAAGKELFEQKCGVCHALADAGTTGASGPNLDTVQPDAARTLSAIINGMGAMPPGLASGQDAEDIAAYVAQASGAE